MGILNFNVHGWSKLYDSIRDGSMEDESLSSIETQIRLANIVNPTRSQDESINTILKEELSYEQ
jgi:hypothetical protein